MTFVHGMYTYICLLIMVMPRMKSPSCIGVHTCQEEGGYSVDEQWTHSAIDRKNIILMKVGFL